PKCGIPRADGDKLRADAFDAQAGTASTANYQPRNPIFHRHSLDAWRNCRIIQCSRFSCGQWSDTRSGWAVRTCRADHQHIRAKLLEFLRDEILYPTAKAHQTDHRPYTDDNA